MQAARGKEEALRRKAKLAHSYQQLLDEFSNKELKSVGNYTLGRLIGKGSFGKVYLATHKLTNGSKVVLKSAKKDDSNLAREIHHHRQFVHPHIARLYEVIVTESMVWLVLEYCSGDELYNYLLNHGPLPVEKVQKIFAQLVGAVSYVHNQSCVHRDLKLENILLDKNENVKLVDFGFTREYEGKSNYLQTFCGTICYSAPEMLRGERYAGEKVDVWSLGVILYALLCGELPFDEDDDNITRNKILTEEPKYPDHLPPEVVPLLKSLLSKRPLLRPSLPEILAHPFLEEHAAQQQAILKLEQPPPFTTPLEKECLERMRSAGVDIDSVIESVLSQRCDALAGWWTLLTEKEERKARRRERKRKEKEQELRNSRRLSAASSRLERLAPIADEDGLSRRHHQQHVVKIGDPPPPRTRGRSERRSGQFADLIITDVTNMPERGLSKDGSSSAVGNQELSPDTEGPPPPPIDKDSIRSASSSRHRRPIPPPKEGILRSARSRGSTLHLVTTSEALGLPPDPQHQQTHQHNAPPGQRVRKRGSQAILATWKNMTHWFFESTRRGRGRGAQQQNGSQSAPNLVDKQGGDVAAGVVAGGGASAGRLGSGSTGKLTKEPSPRPLMGKYAGKGAASPSGGMLLPSPSGNGSPAAHRSSRGAPASPANGHAIQSMAGLPNGGQSSVVGSPTSASASASALSTPSNLRPASGSRGPSGGGGGTSSGQNLYKRQSLSPSPLTPRSSAMIRRSSAGNSISGLPHGLRGRKSTSSSVSSVRSIHKSHHHHSHSKASSTSSNGSVSTSISKTPSGLHHSGGRSPHHSVKVLPATPTSTTFPSNIRLVRAPVMHHGYNEGMIPQPPGSPNPFATGFHHAYRRDHNLAGVGSGSPTVLFAKRKRNIFKGPMLSFGNRNASGSASNSARHASSSGASGGSGSGSHSRSASASGLGRRSGELAITVEEEEGEEDDVGRPSLGLGVGLGMGVSLGMSMAFAGIGGVGELHENVKEGDEDDEIEEVEVFSPVVTRPGERVEEHIFEEGEEVVDKVPSAVATTSGGGEGDRGKQHATTLTNAATTSDVAPVPVANPMSAAVPIIRMPMVGRSASGTAGNGGGASTTTAAASMAAASS